MKCRDQLHELVKEEIEKKDSSTEEWKIAMERSFNRMDNEAEAKAKKMEEEMYRLPESLEERNGQLQASASTAGMGLSEISTVMEFDFSKPISPCFGKAQVEFTEPGICHGFVLWIDWVMDIDNSIALSTGPINKKREIGTSSFTDIDNSIALSTGPIKDTGSKELSCWPSQSQLESMDQVELVKIHSPMRSDPNRVVKWVPDCSTIVAARIASEKLLRGFMYKLLSLYDFDGFKVSCEAKKPVYWTSLSDYFIEDIFYQNNSFHLVNVEVINSRCPAPLHDFAFDSSPFQFGPNFADLYLFYNCSNLFPSNYSQYPITCASNATQNSFAYLDTGTDGFNCSQFPCELSVHAPVEIEGGQQNQVVETMDYAELLRIGFTLEWMGISCAAECENSGGHCGFNNSNSVCFCNDRWQTLQ
ncbi:hypothetical protein TEA_025591 [Camellia sinensis var. sinensis]|uniref:Wall-associated receptor kinase C-terminal domain-containing protein n=1 Tax=Camellia sinensis var. sinensis TaxID=542762 RepID=A0A4S4DA85_CAMSN|nr:hypothetical protein TEA_025591 [Camellia sinensis var. sinensis]